MVQPWIEVSDLNNPSDPYAEYSINAASFLLWSLSGRKYGGVREITEQYICPSYDIPINCSLDDSTKSFWNPSVNAQSYLLLDSPQVLGTRIRLRQFPVRKIMSVSVDGVPLNAGNFHVRNNRILTITDAACPTLCSGPVVTYKYGVAPPDAGKLAAMEMANEFVKSFNGEACGLPEGTQSVSRQGLSIELLDPQMFLDKGRTGMLKVDYFITASNPTNALKPAKIFTPDSPRGYSTR